MIIDIKMKCLRREARKYDCWYKKSFHLATVIPLFYFEQNGAVLPFLLR